MGGEDRKGERPPAMTLYTQRHSPDAVNHSVPGQATEGSTVFSINMWPLLASWLTASRCQPRWRWLKW